ncbi:MAG: hypothetical protein LBF04_07195 [Prevotellaceae bacterium]|jgi:chromosomal replication initiation ATPase DnaA|nr:hypothetical protein [Prevotellaceae bacterium]
MTEFDHYKIINTVCWHYELSFEEIIQPQRTRLIVAARYSLFYFLRRHTDLSLSKIAEICNKKNHSTVILGIRKYEDEIDLYPAKRKLHNQIEHNLLHGNIVRVNFDELICEYEKLI